MSLAIPGDFEKVMSQILMKIRNYGEYFLLGEVHSSTSRISVNTYILAFLQVLMISLHEYFRKGHCDFREN